MGWSSAIADGDLVTEATAGRRPRRASSAGRLARAVAAPVLGARAARLDQSPLQRLARADGANAAAADHGNADYAINTDGTPNTAHTTNPVPCIVISKGVKKIKNGRLADMAPTILKLMDLKKPKEMTGKISDGLLLIF